jgi:hypothetical protein
MTLKGTPLGTTNHAPKSLGCGVLCGRITCELYLFHSGENLNSNTSFEQSKMKLTYKKDAIYL